jgi:NAD(P)-dependent dehydrogenase (short-subunit alcohol dehydrogenase family)
LNEHLNEEDIALPQYLGIVLIVKSDFYKRNIRFPRFKKLCNTGGVSSRKPLAETEKRKFKRKGMDMNISLKNKAALVTGGTSGIGEAAALALGRAGANVVVAGRRESEGQAVVQAIEKAGGEALFIKTDVSRETDVKALVDKTVATFGRLDFAFNNAGVEGTPGLTTDKQTEVNYRHTFDINVLGLIFSMKHEIPAILKSGGAIVNTSSVAGQIGFPGFGVYTASKHAVNGLTRSAALEFAKQGVRVNAIAFGTIDTPMVDRLVGDSRTNNAQRDWLASFHPVGRVGTVEEAAQAVLALLENPFITGSILAVDGGWTAQ